MTTSTIVTPVQIDTAAVMGGLYGDGIIGTKGAFDRDWVRELGEDIELLFQDALKRPGGAVGRGPKRYYVEIHPEGIRGFLDLVTRESYERLPEEVRRHLTCRVVEELEPIVQAHTIEGLVMGEA